MTDDQSMALHEAGYGWALAAGSGRRFWQTRARRLIQQAIAAGVDPVAARQEVQAGIDAARSGGGATTRVAGRRGMPGMSGLSLGAAFKFNSRGSGEVETALLLSSHELLLLHNNLMSRIGNLSTERAKRTPGTMAHKVVTETLRGLWELVGVTQEAIYQLRRR